MDSVTTVWEHLFKAGNRRSWTVEANDGVVATAGFLEGFAGAGASDRTLLLTATLATIVGSLTVAGANWAEAAAEREAQVLLADQELHDLQSEPEAELDELVRYWASKGLSPDLAHRVANELTASDALRAQLEREHGFSEPMPRSLPPLVGLSAGAAYGTGSLIPLAITYLVPVAIEGWAIVAAVLVALVATSLIAGRSAEVSAHKMLARSVAVGVTTMAASYTVGRLLL